ncbi:MAG: PmoA family protein [Verrucomicrobiota bacterium]
MKKIILIIALNLSAWVSGFAAEGFSISAVKGENVTVEYNGKPVVKLMTANDKSSEQKAHETYKVYLHVMDPTDAKGEKTITKGVGDPYTHHRGIYIGWSKTKIDGKSYDTWHMKNGVRQEFAKIISQKATAGSATFTAAINWIVGEELLLSEQRTFEVRKLDEDGAFILDTTSQITAVKADAELNGDPEHAGCQFRASAEVAKNKSAKYLFPTGKMSAKEVTESRDMPWAAMTFETGGKSYHVQHMSHPSLPKPLRYSAYRDYGRFGSFFVTTIKKGESETFKVRFFISPGAFPDSMLEDSKRRSEFYDKMK